MSKKSANSSTITSTNAAKAKETSMAMKELLRSISYCSTAERRERICRILSDKGIAYDIERDDKAINLVVGDPADSLVTICGHYDIVPGSCGANDNGSSCTVMLDLIEKFYDEPGLCFVFLDRAESGFYGSSLHFSRYNPALTVNLDVVGGGEHLVYQTMVRGYEDGSCPTDSHNVDPMERLASLLEGKSCGLAGFLDMFACQRFHALKVSSLPMCDTHNIARLGHEVVTFSAFPEKDAAIIRKTGHLSCTEVMKYMHNGCYDDIEYICTDTMQEVEDLLEFFIISCRDSGMRCMVGRYLNRASR